MITVEQYMDIQSLYREGLSKREIARRLGIDPKTVTRHLERGEIPKYTKRKRRDSKLAPFYQLIDAFLEDDDYKATWIFDKLKVQGYEGSYDLVKIYVRKIKEAKKKVAFVRFETEPAHQMQMDWGEFNVEYKDGSLRKLYVFVMLLGYSRAMYVEFCESSVLEQLLDCHIRGFKHLGGVPRELLYDNMKTVVIGRDQGKIKFHQDFAYFANHYHFTPRACPPYSPWVKGKVERPIKYLRESFWRGYRFTSVDQANNDVLEWLEKVAHQRVHGTYREVVNARWEREKEVLSPLPPSDYDTSRKVFRKVYKDCQVAFEGNRYVVPHEYVGDQVMLKAKADQLRIYFDDELLVTYEIPDQRGALVQNEKFYHRLLKDREQLLRKYNRSGKARAVAKEELIDHQLKISDLVPAPEVYVRPLSEYGALFGQGGGTCKN